MLCRLKIHRWADFAAASKGMNKYQNISTKDKYFFTKNYFTFINFFHPNNWPTPKDCENYSSASAKTPSPKKASPSPKKASPASANKKKRCPAGTRRNKKTGKCENKNKSPRAKTPSPKKASANKKKRCPAGTRRNKKTGNCDNKNK